MSETMPADVLPSGVLYVVATPIGHLGDLSRRAEEVLKSVQIIAAEDTRRTRVLLDHIDHRAPELLSLHDHNEHHMAPELVARLSAGDSVALVSDAGTPLVNDPGYPLVQAAFAAGIRTVPIPGASSITALLSVCPLPSYPFRFVGFLPSKSKARTELLEGWLSSPDAVVFLEAPHRIVATLEDLARITERRVMLGRELTKTHESILVGTAAVLAQEVIDQARGEFIGVIEAAEVSPLVRDSAAVLRVLLKELPPSQAAKLAASICGTRKADMYDLALSLPRD